MRRSRYGREVAVMPQNVAERVAKRGGILRVRNWQLALICCCRIDIATTPFHRNWYPWFVFDWCVLILACWEYPIQFNSWDFDRLAIDTRTHTRARTHTDAKKRHRFVPCWGMVIGGSFYATMLAVFAFGIILFKTQDHSDWARDMLF